MISYAYNGDVYDYAYNYSRDCDTDDDSKQTENKQANTYVRQFSYGTVQLWLQQLSLVAIPSPHPKITLAWCAQHFLIITTRRIITSQASIVFILLAR